MPISKPWKFTQLGGAKKTLVLLGTSAPFGRPRVGPVVEDDFSLRQSEVYYPGNAKPTRHIFGDRTEPWELHGRWTDEAIGAGGARAKRAFVRQFIRDAQPVRAEWGDILTATGIILRMVIGFESEAQLAWKLTIAIDSDDAMAPASPTRPTATPKDGLSKLLKAIGRLNGLPNGLPDDIEFQTSFLDAIDSLVSAIGSISGALLDIANGIDDFEKAASSELNRLRGVVGQFRTALLTLKMTLDDATSDFAISQSSGNSQTTWAQEREAARIEAIGMLAILAELDAQAEVALRGQVDTTLRATSGDSWEKLSSRQYGGPGHADALRQANAARFGTQPQPGRTLNIPKP